VSRRKQPRLMRTIAAGLAVVIVAVGAMVVLRAGSGRAASPTPSAAPGASPSPLELHLAPGATFVPALEGKRPIYILALGSDARPGQGIDAERADSIHIIAYNPAAGRGTILGIPRDSWVNIPGHGTDKINASLSDGGPALTIKTVEALTGIKFDFYAITSFVGLTRMINGLRGVNVQVTQPMHDPLSHSNFNPGKHHLSGWEALAYARDRHSFLSGDLTRSANQGTLMLAALTQFKKLFKNNPVQLLSIMATTWANVRTDVPPATLYKLALTASQVHPRNVTNLVVPATTGMEGAQSVVFISSGAKALYAQLRRNGYIAR